MHLFHFIMNVLSWITFDCVPLSLPLLLHLSLQPSMYTTCNRKMVTWKMFEGIFKISVKQIKTFAARVSLVASCRMLLESNFRILLVHRNPYSLIPVFLHSVMSVDVGPSSSIWCYIHMQLEWQCLETARKETNGSNAASPKIDRVLTVFYKNKMLIVMWKINTMTTVIWQEK